MTPDHMIWWHSNGADTKLEQLNSTTWFVDAVYMSVVISPVIVKSLLSVLQNMLTCLHYAFIFFEDKDREPAQLLQSAGASVDWCCTVCFLPTTCICLCMAYTSIPGKGNPRRVNIS